jgi:hypothetical protein
MTKRHQKADFARLELAIEIYQGFYIIRLNVGNGCPPSQPRG